MAKKQASNRGGVRPGAGMKPGPLGTKRPITVKLSPLVHEFFASLEESRGIFIERIVLSSNEFETWRKSFLKKHSKSV